MIESGTDSMRINLERKVDESYDIVFGRDLFPRIAKDLKESPLASRYVIIADSNVFKTHSQSLLRALRSEELKVDDIFFNAGENSKTMQTCSKIMDDMARLGCGRDTAILALGGGVTGDMAGFIAAIFNRGIPYVQIPTTVLAQADSSVGGKTAVDTQYGKNLVGAFKQPERVYIDVDTLKTLPDREYRSGLAETIKHGVIQDADFFEYLYEFVDEIINKKSPESSLKIAVNNCRIKGRVVEMDPHEKGRRRILNYGHTIGHAIEKLSLRAFETGESPDYLRHGEVVAIGMTVAAKIAELLNLLSVNAVMDQEKLLRDFGLPVKIPGEFSNEEIIASTKADKKAAKGKARYVLPAAIGAMHDFGGTYATEVDNEVVDQALKETR
jgi:3-dehydroquinate synthase